MPLNWNEIRQRAITFSREWADASSERAEAQTFWSEFFHVFGKHRRTVATFEESGYWVTGSTHRIDVFWPTKLIGEQKSRGQDLSKAHTQAVGYITDLIYKDREAEAPRYIITTDFARTAVHVLERFIVRVLFCLFAEDTGIFEPDAFRHFLLQYTRYDVIPLINGNSIWER